MSNYAFAEKLNYSTATKSISAIEKDMMMCSTSPDEAGECYEDTIEKYNLIIKDVRSSNASKVDAKLWQAINLSYKKQIDSCRSDYNTSTKRHFFYPYQDCLTNSLHNLAITAVELHLK